MKNMYAKSGAPHLQERRTFIMVRGRDWLPQSKAPYAGLKTSP
jgi:hypothetical protein